LKSLNLRERIVHNLRELKKPPNQVPDRYLALSIFVVLGIAAPILNMYWLQVVIYGTIMGMIAMSNDLLHGYSGIFAIAPLAFWTIGAFSAAILSGGYHPYIIGGGSEIGLGINPWLTIIIAGLLTAVVGVIISFPTLRLKGVLVAFMMIVFNTLLQRVITNEQWLTGGQIGFQLAHILPWLPNTRIAYFYLVLASVVATFIVLKIVVRSKIGLALRAMGDNELAAKQLGVNFVKYRVIAFFISSFFIGVAGAIYAYTFIYINDSMVNISSSFLVIVMAILGGVGTLVGPLGGALVYTIVSEYLRFLDLWRYVILGLILIVVILFVPQGIFGTLLQYIERYKAKRKGEQTVAKM
jgi:branched-chain amino acid transport system permease protein